MSDLERQLKAAKTRIQNLSEELRVALEGPRPEPYVWKPIVSPESVAAARAILRTALDEHAFSKRFTLSRHETRAIEVLLLFAEKASPLLLSGEAIARVKKE